MTTPTPKIFIVDDEPLLTSMLGDYLHEQGHNWSVRAFATGEDCLQQLHQQPDLVVLDYYLNSREKDAANGIDILREIKDRNKALPVIMLSSQQHYGTAAQTIRYGAIHYVMKGQDAFQEIYDLIKANLL